MISARAGSERRSHNERPAKRVGCRLADDGGTGFPQASPLTIENDFGPTTKPGKQAVYRSVCCDQGPGIFVALFRTQVKRRTVADGRHFR